jgi:dienelactone hydrolase
MRAWNVKSFLSLAITLLLTANAAAAPREFSLDELSIPALQNYPCKASALSIHRLARDAASYIAYDFSYTSMERKVTGRFAVPKTAPDNIKGLVLMLRGHQDARGYYTGKGTEYPARRYLEAGWAVAAPDFLGFAGSDAAPRPVQAHQLYSVINAAELYYSLLAPDIRYERTVPQASRIELPSSFKKIVLWGHSNGGHVAIHLLAALSQPRSTVRGAPVRLPWPDNVSHYGRNSAWADEFKKSHDESAWSFLNYLGSIAPGTPILLEQGDKDWAVPKEWNDAFAEALRAENAKRPPERQIRLEYKVWPGANHNLEPFWPEVFKGDLAFWSRP